MVPDQAIVHYKTFSTNEEMVKWQEETKPHIFSISPLGYQSVDNMAMEGDTWKVGMKQEISVFVLFTPVVPSEKPKAVAMDGDGSSTDRFIPSNK